MNPSLEEQLTAAQSAASNAAISQWLNYNITLKDENLVHLLGFQERHIGNPLIRALHGGVITAFLEFSAKCALTAYTEQKIQTVSTAVDFLSSSKASDMSAHVQVRRIGRRIVFTETSGWQEDQMHPVAIAQTCFRLK